MRRIFCGLLAGFFLIYAAEVPFGFFKDKSLSAVSCCCKDSAARSCKHINRMCHLNKQLSLNAKAVSLGSVCHSTTTAKPNKILENRDYSIFSALNCGFSKDKSVYSSYPKEFCLISYLGISPYQASEPFSLNKEQGFILFLDRRLDKPPRFIPHFSL